MKQLNHASTEAHYLPLGGYLERIKMAVPLETDSLEKPSATFRLDMAGEKTVERP